MKTIYLVVTLILLVQQNQVPLKPKEDFELLLDYQFKQRPPADTQQVSFSESRKEYDRRTSNAVLPYLKVNLKFLKLSGDEVRIRVDNNLNRDSFTRKISQDSTLPLDLGFTDDMKDKVTAHQYTVTTLNKNKEPLSRIILLVEEDGTFIVNGEKRGRF